MASSNRNLSSHSSTGWKLEIKATARLVPPVGAGERIHSLLFLNIWCLLAILGLPPLWLHKYNPYLSLHRPSLLCLILCLVGTLVIGLRAHPNPG
jgi:hypothetical protein